MPLLPGDQRSQAKIAVGVVALAAAGYYYTYPYAATAERMVEQSARAEKLEAANGKAKRQASLGVSPDSLRREAARSRATLDLLRRLVPAEHEVPGLLEQVSTAARRAGLDLGGVAPEPVLVGSSFDTYRYKITVAGNYHALAEFLGNVGSLPRIVAPVTFQLSLVNAQGEAKTAAAAAARAASDRGLPLQASVTMQTYVAHSAPAKGAGGVAAKTASAASATTPTAASGGEVIP